MKQLIMAGLALALVGVGALGGIAALRHHEATVTEAAALRYRAQVQINDSTVALLAREQARGTELQGLVNAERQLNGKLVAGVRLTIKRAGQGNTIPIVAADSGRRFRDSTAVGTLTGTVLDSTLSYRFTPSAVTPEIGFVKLGNRYAATASCQGCDSVTIDAPFVDASVFAKLKVPRAVPFVGGQYDVATKAWTARLGLDYRLFFGLVGTAEGRYTFAPSEQPRLLVGAIKRF